MRKTKEDSCIGGREWSTSVLYVLTNSIFSSSAIIFSLRSTTVMAVTAAGKRTISEQESHNNYRLHIIIIEDRRVLCVCVDGDLRRSAPMMTHKNKRSAWRRRSMSAAKRGEQSTTIAIFLRYWHCDLLVCLERVRVCMFFFSIFIKGDMQYNMQYEYCQSQVVYLYIYIKSWYISCFSLLYSRLLSRLFLTSLILALLAEVVVSSWLIFWHYKREKNELNRGAKKKNYKRASQRTIINIL